MYLLEPLMQALVIPINKLCINGMYMKEDRIFKMFIIKGISDNVSIIGKYENTRN